MSIQISGHQTYVFRTSQPSLYSWKCTTCGIRGHDYYAHYDAALMAQQHVQRMAERLAETTADAARAREDAERVPNDPPNTPPVTDAQSDVPTPPASPSAPSNTPPTRFDDRRTHLTAEIAKHRWFLFTDDELSTLLAIVEQEHDFLADESRHDPLNPEFAQQYRTLDHLRTQLTAEHNERTNSPS